MCARRTDACPEFTQLQRERERERQTEGERGRERERGREERLRSHAASIYVSALYCGLRVHLPARRVLVHEGR